MTTNGTHPGKLPITSGLAKWRSVWKPEVFCALWSFVVVQAVAHPIRHFAKPPGVIVNARAKKNINTAAPFRAGGKKEAYAAAGRGFSNQYESCNKL